MNRMFKDKFGFNFWPSFTDLMMSFILVLLITFFILSMVIRSGNENLKRARASEEQIQSQVEETIGSQYKVKTIDYNKDDVQDVARIMSEYKADIYLINKLDRQTITFSDKVLFDSDASEIKTDGQNVLRSIAPVIVKNLNNISEIQIQGHADNSYTEKYNLNLAAERAMAVYNFLEDDTGIDPNRYMMSATSFGMYKPVGREPGNPYDANKIQSANQTDELKAKNRRIEIVLFFKNAKR